MSDSPAPRVAYVTEQDPTDVRAWSGLSVHIARALEGSGLPLTRIGPLREPRPLFYRAKQAYTAVVQRQRHLRWVEPEILRMYGQQANRALKGTGAEVVFCPGSLVLPHIGTDLPCGFWSDATFASVLHYYAEYAGLDEASITNGHAMERAALERANLCIYASHYAAQSAIDYYGIDPSKVHVVEWGANLDIRHTRDDVIQMVEQRPRSELRLVFSGVDWIRKGGDIALRVAERLHARGVPVRFTIIGTHPKGAGDLPEFAHTTGFLAKDTPEGERRIAEILASSHVFIMPSRAESYGLVYCEANAFGLPCIATDAGGIPTIVRPDVNGRLFTREASVAEYVDYLEALFNDRARYEALALSSFDEYIARLNWDVAGMRVRALIENTIVTAGLSNAEVRPS